MTVKERNRKHRAYRHKHPERARYSSTRSTARTFFNKYIKKSDLPEFKKRLKDAEIKFNK